MKKLLVAALIAGSFISFEARAGDRAGDAALGAVSGAVVLGPVGAVAGALIGYTAGPSIARSWGIGRSASRSRARRETQAMSGTQEPGTQQQAAARVVSSSPVKNPEMPAANRTPTVEGFEEKKRWRIKSTIVFQKSFDTSGKSRAYRHHRKNFRARAGNRPRAFSIEGGDEEFTESVIRRRGARSVGADIRDRLTAHAGLIASAQNVLTLSAIAKAEVHEKIPRNGND
jgi:hypothetical protein